jgi:two-component system, NarL family, response regulator LiaR
MERIRILVADDHKVLLEGLCRLLKDEEDLEVVGRASDGEEAVKLAKELLPDVAIMDVSMPGINGIEAARQITEACPNTAILMVSAYDYESYVAASLKAGAAGYMLKNAPIDELVSAVRLIHKGEAVFDLKAIKRAMGRPSYDDKGEGRSSSLHPRELEVLKLTAKGMSNKAIARELGIAERTVETHMVNIFKKLKAGSRTEAVLRAVKEGWITSDDLP